MIKFYVGEYEVHRICIQSYERSYAYDHSQRNTPHVRFYERRSMVLRNTAIDFSFIQRSLHQFSSPPPSHSRQTKVDVRILSVLF